VASVVLIAGRDPRANPECSHCAYLRTQARAALRAGHAVHMLCLAPRNATAETDFGVVHTTATAWRTLRQNRIAWFSPILAARAAALVAALGRERTVLHGVGVWGHAAARADALLDGARALVQGAYTTHLDETASQWRGLSPAAGWRIRARLAFELAWSRAVVSRYEAEAHRRARRVLVNYRAVQRLVARRFGVDAALVPHTAEQEFLDPRRARPGNRADAPGPARILCVARHDPRKGIDVLLHALLRLKRQGRAFSATLVGGGALLEAHRALARTLGLADCVDIAGIVPRVEPYLDAADIFVLPSREEQSGSLALLEAMRAGLACVASGCDGIPEDVRHGEDVWLAAPGDAAALAAGLGVLIADPALRRSLAAGARQRFEQAFSADAMTAALDRVYREVLAEARAEKHARSAGLSRGAMHGPADGAARAPQTWR
jgi:glycosyltransferase involved in cell wall biosynthesis